MPTFYAIEHDPDRNLRLGTITEDGDRIVVYHAASAHDVVEDMTRRGCHSVEVHEPTAAAGPPNVTLTCDHRGKPFTLESNGQIRCSGCGAIEGAPRRVGGRYETY